MSIDKGAFLMLVEELTKEELVRLVQDTVREELKTHKHQCRFSVSDEQAQAMGRYLSMIGRMGDGDLDEGFEVIKANHKWLEEMRQKGNSLSSAFFIALVTGSIGILGVLLFEGLKKKLMGN
jgi:hypothetical protein